MTEFTASNGITVSGFDSIAAGVGGHRNCLRLVSDGIELSVLTPGEWRALDEFFRDERDRELGRWRWPENPGYVVYPWSSDYLNVMYEKTGVGYEHRRRDVDASRTRAQVPDSERAARGWFDTHPEPKPWHKAKPGEIWELSFTEEGGGGPEGWIVDREFRFTSPLYVSKILREDSTIIAGRRIWPEATS